MDFNRDSIDGPTMQHYLRKGHVERALATRALFGGIWRFLNSGRRATVDMEASQKWPEGSLQAAE